MYDNLKKIEQIYYMPGNHLVCLEGKKGTGKTTVLQEFISTQKNVIQVESFDNYDNYLTPIANALYKYFHSLKCEFIEVERYRDATYEDEILEQLLKICTNSKCAILLYDFTDYSPSFIKFIQKAISAILRNGKNCSIFIEIDLDDSSIMSKISSIYSFPQLQHIRFLEVVPEELKKVFRDENPNLNISERDLDYIISSSNKNPALMNIIVNYLKANNYITYHENNYVCKPLKMGILSDILKEDFLSRFNRLDELMKVTFLKSSMFGMEFRAFHLKNSYEILSANEILEKIERDSNLLFQKEKTRNLYSFSNPETLYFAKSIITGEQKKDWGNILFRYYRKLWMQTNKTTPNSYENFALRAAVYAIVAGEYEEAESFYIAAVFAYIKKNHFQQALLLLNEINKLPNNKKRVQIIDMHLIELRAVCCENLGLYKEACYAYKTALDKFSKDPYFDTMFAEYHLAYCTYYTSQVDLALELAESLKNKLDSDSRNDSLYYELVSLLATLYREKANPKFEEMYLVSINECKTHKFEYAYYVQLRKADLCYDVELSIPMIQKAADYFEANNYRNEYGKSVHNLGTDFLYIGNAQNAKYNLKKSKTIFANFGSTDEVYAINCLGVYYAIVEKDYHKALQSFHEAESMEINDFKKMTIYANIAACFQKLHRYDECKQYIYKCENLPARKQNVGVGFYERTILFAWAFYYMERKEYASSLQMIRSCWSTNLKNDQSYLAAICAMDLCNILHCTPLDIEWQFWQISHSNLYEEYYKNGTLLHTLRFIE